MEKYYGNYRGIVVDTNDTEERNRVKIFIPQISLPLLEKINIKKEDFFFRSIGENTLDNLPAEILEKIINLLPWAEYAAPLFGGGSAAHYNPVSKTATTTTGTAAPTLSSESLTSSDITIKENAKDTTYTGGGVDFGDRAPSRVATAPSAPSVEYHKSKEGPSTNVGEYKPGTIEYSRLELFIAAVGQTETGWGVAEAYRNLYNYSDQELRSFGIPGDSGKSGTTWRSGNNNVNKSLAGKKGYQSFKTAAAARAVYGDYGFLQTNNGDYLDKDLNGRLKSATSRAEQLAAGIRFLYTKKRKEYNLIAKGQFEQARQALQQFWFGLKDKKSTFDSVIYNPSFGNKVLEKARDTTSIDTQSALAAGAKLDRAEINKLSSNSYKGYIEGEKSGGTKDYAETAETDVTNTTYRASNPLAEQNVSTPIEGIPGGIFSTPKVGAHVWVFFEGGDPMYPVYFAQHIVPEDIRTIKQASSPAAKSNIDTATQRIQTSQIAQPGAGNLEFITQVFYDEIEGDVEQSGVKLSCQGGGVYAKMSSGTIDYSPVVKSSTTDGDEFHSVYGDQSEFVAGANEMQVAEDFTLTIGKIDDESLAAARDIYKELEPIHNKRRNRVVPVGKAPCPNCNRTILSTRGDAKMSIAARVLGKIIDKLIPRKGVAKDFIKDILTVTLKPIKAERQKKFMTSDSCGPSCTNHTVDTYTGPGSTKGDDTYLTDLERAQNKIIDLEKKTGFGGDYKVKVARNASLVVGLAPNTLEPFREIPNLQVLKGVEFYSGQGAMGFKSDSIKQYEPLEMVTPDLGNYDILVGNKLHIKSGGGGVFMETTGQLNMHGGTVDITGNSVVVGNNQGVTKINGAALQLYSDSIQLGESASNVHVLGSMHCAANFNAMGSIYSQGGLAAGSLDIPYEIEKTSTSSSPDYVGETAKWLTTGGSALKAVSASWKSILQYTDPGQIGYLATAAGIDDMITETMSLIMSVIPIDGLTGIGVCAVGPVLVFNFPHMHPASTNAHYHSYSRPRGTKVNGTDQLMDYVALNGTPTPNVMGLTS